MRDQYKHLDCTHTVFYACISVLAYCVPPVTHSGVYPVISVPPRYCVQCSPAVCHAGA